MNNKDAKEDFVHLHVHSDMSQLDGCGKIKDYVDAAANRGSPAIAFTEHGTMRGFHHVHVACEEAGIKAIHGIEFYVARDMSRKGMTPEERTEVTSGLKPGEYREAIKQWEGKEGIRDRWHITVWAKNDIGLKNLFKLSTEAYTEGFYYKPRIDMSLLIKYREGLIVATGCQSSIINDRVILGQRKQAIQEAERLREAFGEDLWLEVQPHDMDDQVVANKFAMELKERWGAHARLLATQDAHYVEHSDAIHHEVLLCIGTNDNMSNPHRFRFTGDEFYFKTRKEMYRSFMDKHGYMGKQYIKEALDNTLELASQAVAKVHIDYHAALLPHIEVPSKYRSEWEYLKHLCSQGFAWRDIPSRIEKVAKKQGKSYEEMLDVYQKRYQLELTALYKQDFVSYFLLVHDLYDWARKQGIMCGPGRGSVAGSLVSFLLGFTSVDPIEHGLIFERFINPDRIDMPDVDMDFEDARRKEIFDYLRNKYGHDKVAQIATVGKLSGKQCLKDVSRVLEVPYAAVNQVTNSIIERSSGDERVSQTIEDSFKDFKVCREFNEKYPDVLKHAKRLEGMAKNLGIHAAGVVVSPDPLVEHVPLETRKHDGEDIVVTAVDMHGVSALGLVKLDVLGLRTLTVLRECLNAIEQRHGLKIDLERDVPLDDKPTLQLFTDHDYVGIFQYDTAGADKICVGVKFVDFEDIAAMTALNRPGTARSGLATQYVERKKHPKKIFESAFHPAVSEITKDTLGIIVYQEHVIKIFTEIAGFAPGTADSLRKSIAKKYGDETIGKERENFIKGAMAKTGMTEKQAAKIMDAITFFGSYGFNKSHATAYGIIAYWGMWLKRYYPIEFYWALLKNETQRIRVQSIARDAKNHGIELLPPDVSSSKENFTIDPSGKAIRGSLVDIKGVGDKAAETIMSNQPYKDIWDFYDRVDRRRCHKGVVMALAKSGALDAIVPNIKWFIENMETIWQVVSKNGQPGSVARQQLTRLVSKSVKAATYDKEERQLLASSVSPLAFGRHPIDAYGDFIAQHVKVPLVSMSEENFFKDNDNKSVYVYGVIVEVKFNQIGDFHSGALPSQETMDKMYWGARYANVNVEDGGGVQNRIKFDIGIFDEMRPLIDSGVGTPVIVHATANEKFQNLKANFAIDLAKYRQHVLNKEPLSVWERIIQGRHPASEYPWKTKKLRDKRMGNEIAEANRYGHATYCGVVTNIKKKFDRKDNEMAFVGLLGMNQHIEVVYFGSHWVEIENKVKMGKLVVMSVEKKPDKWRGASYTSVGGKDAVWIKNDPI